ncbi:acyltransferase family protein [Acinetobacter guerrae]|uniref:acyltransferase family protein n=1 Tax=Acinetobacter guerrae TaxID=1843371 RepID=UPI00128D53D3|nr:acyltransferase family protein [Acinetobacter guerrae]MPW42948.1 hypothetical protein [Acinetobacter guerrae]
MRDTSLDKAKGLLIFLVVFGHILERFIGWNDLSGILLTFIYSFHMPAFIFISGLFFKNHKLFEKTLFFIVLAVSFQLLYLGFNLIFIDHQNWLGWVIKPYWILWYLWGMVAWSLLTSLLIKSRYPLLIAILASLGIGLSPFNNYLFSIGRIFVFLPFFVIGAIYGKSFLNTFQKSSYWLWITSASLMILIIALAFLQPNHYWLYGSLSYQQLQMNPLNGIVTRLMLFFLAICGTISLLACASKLPEFFRALGEQTLAIYLLHGFFIIALSHFAFIATTHPVLNIICCLVISSMLCIILKAKFLSRIIQKNAMNLTQLLLKPIHYFYKR